MEITASSCDILSLKQKLDQQHETKHFKQAAMFDYVSKSTMGWDALGEWDGRSVVLKSERVQVQVQTERGQALYLVIAYDCHDYGPEENFFLICGIILSCTRVTGELCE